MTVQVGKTQNPIALFCQNLFHTGSVPARVEAARHRSISLDDLAAMPKEAQLLLAHCLERNNRDLTLLDDDTDVCKLLSAGWLISVPCPTIGIICFSIKPVVWRRLCALCPKFLNPDLLSELKVYRKRKSAAYPWIWQARCSLQ